MAAKSDMVQVREVFVPRKGWVFIQTDYEQLELYTLAAICKKIFGFSDLSDALAGGLDPHTELGGVIGHHAPEEARALRASGNKAFDAFRQAAKVGNFGLPGGLGPDRFVDFAWGNYKVVITKSEALSIKAAWMARWSEMKLYFEYINKIVRSGDPLICQFTGAVRGDAKYTNACNDGFQRLGAVVAKEAVFMVSRACYTGDAPGLPLGKSPLLGSRIVNFIHDEIITETLDNENAHDAAMEQARLMYLAAKIYLPEVTPKAPPTLQRYWSKAAKAVFDTNGRLVPWGDKVVA